jgi:flagellum-specific ATP synthase
MHAGVFDGLRAAVGAVPLARRAGRVTALGGGVLTVSGLAQGTGLGDRVTLWRQDGRRAGGEVLRLARDGVVVLADDSTEGFGIGDLVALDGPATLSPDDGWIGRIVDPSGRPLDGRPLLPGRKARGLRSAPPPAAARRRLGARLETGMCVFNTLLPLARGQRLGLFAGSGVGKSSLLARFARGVAADVVVIAMIGERGRELREFTERVLGPEGLAQSVVVAATSDQSPLVRRRAALAAMTVAEHFRDEGLQVLLLADSVTRFAEAHREVALAGGEAPSLRGYPPSVAHAVMALAERAGPGVEGTGDITAVFTVLVAGSDMEEPVADILRGTLDGHVVLDRRIAERGRFPAIDLLRSVSRSLPDAASAEENRLIGDARKLLGAYDRAETMIQAGLYAAGSDPVIDAAIKVWPALDAFLAQDETEGTAKSFARLARSLQAR